MAKSFQLPMVIALLSMRTNFINQDSMIEALIELPRKLLEVDGSKNRSFWRSTLRPDARVDVQVFEELYSEFCKYMVGEGSVTEGPQHDHRGILRLDADPKVADTTKARGSGPATMAMAYKTQWIGARQGRPDKLKAKLRLQRELEGEIDENEDFNETEAQLVNDGPPKLSALGLYTLQELINATCRRRQNAAQRDFVKKHGRRVPNQKLRSAYTFDRVRKTLYAKCSHRAL